MKKTAKILVTLILALSFAVTAFAAPVIDYIVKDTVDGKEYYFFFGSYDDEETPSEAGITLNGKDYKLSLPSMTELPKSKRFGMAISDASNVLGDSFTAVPYTRDAFGIKTEGEEKTVVKTAVNEPRDYLISEASEVISGFYANDWGIVQQVSNAGTIHIETDSRANLGFTMDPIGVAIFKLDLTKLTECDINRKFKLNAKGYNFSGDINLDHMTFGSYVIDDSWSDVEAVVTEDVGKLYKNFIYKKIPMDTVYVSRESMDFSIDISTAVYRALKAGKSEAIVALAPDNTECKNLSLADGLKYNTMYTFYIEGKNAPSITYYTEDKAGYNADISYIKAGNDYLPGVDEGKTEFNVYLPYGTTEMPVVTAASVSESANVSVAQATFENKKAVITVTPKYADAAKTYTVNFIESVERPSETHVLRQSETNVFSDFYSIDPLTKKSAPAEANVQRSGSGASAVENKGSTDNLQDSFIFMQIDLSKLPNLHKGSPVMLKLHGELLSDSADIESTDLEIYPVSEDIWATLNDADFTKGIFKTMDIEGVIGNKKPIAVKTLTKAGGYWFTTTIGDHELDISSYIAYCLDNNQTKATVALRVKPLDLAANYTARFRMWHDRSYITYTDTDMSGYEYELGTIKVDGNSIYNFDKEKTFYNWYVPYGTENYPVVTATAEKGKVSVIQATKENPVAIVTVSPEYPSEEAKEYIISFIEGAESAEASTPLACSYTGILADAFSIDANYNKNATVDTNFKYVFHNVTARHGAIHNPYAGAYNILPSVTYLKLDLTKLENICTGKPVTLDLYGALGANDTAIAGADMELYSVADSIWTTIADEDLTVSASAAMDLGTVVNEKNFISKVYVERTEEGLWTTAGATHHSFDITQFVNYCIDNGITTPTVAVRLNPGVATNPAMRFQFYTNSSTQSKVTYYKNAVIE